MSKKTTTVLLTLLGAWGLAGTSTGQSVDDASTSVPSPSLQPKGQIGSRIDPPNHEFFRGRRQALMASVDGGVILVRGAASIETYERFHQSHTFWYLTGVEEPDCALVLVPKTGEEILVVPPYNPMKAQWDGPTLRPGNAGQEATGIAEVVPGSSKTLIRLLGEALERCGDRKAIWCPQAPEERGAASRDNLTRYQAQWQRDPLDGRRDRNSHLADALRREFEGVAIDNLSPALDALRTIKQPEELRVLRYAAELACAGIGEAMKAVRPGQKEYELGAIAEYTFKRHGAVGISYMPIVGSGPNGCILHHWRNARTMQDGELVVMDFAPSVHGYVADVTRTFPVSGKFTEAQRKLVSDVFDAQKAIIEAIRPGVSLAKLSSIGSKLLVERGYKPGIHILHGPCHHLGLSVHDVSKNGFELRPGMYITVEPGVYLTDEGMGCRIEDCVLVTEDGCEVLSRGCPSTPDEIEAFMREKGLADVPGARG
ncbi:MAG: aminopeptidase P family protein [Planctomycetes bacterium]|nr:aminopeptidase P family protein [Planctomycetota bacterium]